ncbi:MAG: cytochrome d ubiquinol oxidase subunit II, partial [Calditrichaeota bacterium]
MGLVAFFTLSVHGANFLALKSENHMQERARTFSRLSAWGVLLSSILALIAITRIRPGIWDNYLHHPWGFIFPLVGLMGLIGIFYFRRQNRDLQAFLASSAFIVGMGAATAFGLYPNLLPASTGPAYHLTVFNSAAGAYGLKVGLVWWSIGIVLAAGYFVYLFYSFRGKIKLPAEGEGY